jgi:hypothetical protein
MISSAGIYIGGDTSPFPDMRVQLWGDLGGYPNKNNIIASGDIIDGSTITFSGQMYYIDFQNPLQVTLGQTYWVIIDGYHDQNATGDCRARRNTINPYLGGHFKYSNTAGVSWSTSSTWDLEFQVRFYQPVPDGYFESIDIVLPVGMTWETFFIDKNEPSGTSVYFSILNATTEVAIPGFANLNQDTVDMASIDPDIYTSIKLIAYLFGDQITSPIMYYWAINWVPGPSANAGPDDMWDEDIIYTFDGSGSWSSIGIANYAWDMDAGDGIDWDSPDCEGSDLWNPTHVYNNPGIYIVTLNVTDMNGNWDLDTMTLIVNDLTPPYVDAGPDDITDEDAPYSFDASGTWDNSGSVSSYLWDMDASDGIQWSSPDYVGIWPVHTYLEPGTYFVSLNASDDSGNWNIRF